MNRASNALPQSRPTGSNRPGVTLVELLIAMTLAGVLIASLSTVIVSHLRSVEQLRSNAVQLEQVRSSTHLLGTEIGDLVRGSVTVAKPDSLVLRLPVAWGVVCGEDARDKKTAGKVKKGKETVSTTSSIYLEPIATDLGIGDPDGFALSPDGQNWIFHDFAGGWSSAGIIASTTARDACLGDANRNGAETNLYADFPNLLTYIATIPRDGMVMFAFTNITVFFRHDASQGGRVLYRGRVGATAQPLAWPFAATAGFRYRLDSGSEVTSATGSNLDKIRAIQVRLTSQGEMPAQSDTIDIVPWVLLYNAR
jgi:prepilin-type N-terminal cleavage/methylation domain-containing protein